MIKECQERGACITKTNVLQVVSDIFRYGRKIDEGLIKNDEKTTAARVAYIDSLNSDAQDIQSHRKWYRNFRDKHKLKLKKPQMLSKKRCRVTEGQVRTWFADRLTYFREAAFGSPREPRSYV